MPISSVGPFPLNEVTEGDCRKLILDLPDDSIDVIVTSPPYWGQRAGPGIGGEADPRDYLASLAAVFTALAPKLKPRGVAWINLGDAYNTPVNWRAEQSRIQHARPRSLPGLGENNSAYVKPRRRRKPSSTRSALAPVREPPRAPVPARHRDVRRGLALPRRGDVA